MVVETLGVHRAGGGAKATTGAGAGVLAGAEAIDGATSTVLAGLAGEGAEPNSFSKNERLSGGATAIFGSCDVLAVFTSGAAWITAKPAGRAGGRGMASGAANATSRFGGSGVNVGAGANAGAGVNVGTAP